MKMLKSEARVTWSKLRDDDSEIRERGLMNSSLPLLDITELSRRLRISKGTLYNWCYLRRIPFVKIGRCLRFDPDEVDRIAQNMPPLDRAAKGRRST